MFATDQRSSESRSAPQQSPARAVLIALSPGLGMPSVLQAASPLSKAQKDASPFEDRDRARARQIARLLGVRKNR